MASKAALAQWLETSVQQRVLSRQEAWLVQDEILKNEIFPVKCPRHIRPLCQRLSLWEMPVPSAMTH